MPAPYPLEFRREAVALLKSSGKSVPQLASELGISPKSLRNWARQIDVDAGKAESETSERVVEMLVAVRKRGSASPRPAGSGR
jgi:transposase